MGVAVTGQMGWVEGKKRGRGIACEKKWGKTD